MSRKRRRVRSTYQRLGLPLSSVDAGRRGLVLLQIDALSYYVAKSSLGRRFMPFLNRLVHKGGYTLHRYTPGLPATTPAFQAGLMWGYSDHVPGFRWIEKERNEVRVMKSATDARELEADVASRAPGLLEGGACHCAIFSGGAERTTLTMSRLGTPDPYTFSGARRLLLLLLDLVMILRVLLVAAWEVLVEVYETLRAEYEGRVTRGALPFLAVRVLTNVAFRELALRNALIDLGRAVPVMYLNFAGYDELAHHRGPMSVSARLALRGIDRCVRRVFRAASRQPSREYDVYVFSDHGQVPTIPFERLYGASLRDTLAQALLVGVAEVPEGMTDLESARIQMLLTVQRNLEQILPRPLARASMRIGEWVRHRLPDDPSSRPYQVLSEIALMPTSDLCHLYFTSTPHKLAVDEIRRRFPTVLDVLARHPGIWAVAGMGGPDEDGRPTCELFNERGSVRLFESGRREALGQSPLEQVALADGMDHQLRRLALLPTSGDLVLVGARVHGKVVNFQVEMGGHGGPYDEEQSAFMVAPPGAPFDSSTVSSPTDLYRFFYERYRRPLQAQGASAHAARKTA